MGLYGLMNALAMALSPKKAFQLVDIHVLPLALLVMLFSIPYCANMSFLVTYVETLHLPVTVSLFFPLYAGILFVLRLGLKKFFDTWPFSVFLAMSAVASVIGLTGLTLLDNNWFLALGAFGMVGSYGIIYSVCQAEAIKRVAFGKRGLANSTFYVGLDLGMALGPTLGGFIYGHVSLTWFYPVLLVTIPLAIIVYVLDPYK